jgi:hypothetical protein
MQEGLIPLRAWIKDALDRIIQTYLAAPDLEFVWVGDDAIDPLQQAQTLQIPPRRPRRCAYESATNSAFAL